MSEPIKLFLRRTADIHCLIDPEDYEWAIKWKWDTVGSRNCLNRYASRATWANGKRARLYLHKEIMKRSGVKPKYKDRTMVDHINGNTLDNRRCNLRWANAAMNRHNDRDGRKKKGQIKEGDKVLVKSDVAGFPNGVYEVVDGVITCE